MSDLVLNYLSKLIIDLSSENIKLMQDLNKAADLIAKEKNIIDEQNRKIKTLKSLNFKLWENFKNKNQESR